jgi:hypothetical protein
MGAFYTSHTVFGVDHDRIVEAMKGRKAALSQTVNGVTVVWDAESESQDDKVIKAAAQHLSSTLAAPVLAVLNHDSDILMYWLYSAQGELVDEYNSCPGYFEGEDTPPSGGDAALLIRTFAPVQPPEVIERILRDREYVFADDRHAELVASMGLPEFAARTGYGYVTQGDFDDLVNLTLTE